MVAIMAEEAEEAEAVAVAEVEVANIIFIMTCCWWNEIRKDNYIFGAL